MTVIGVVYEIHENELIIVLPSNIRGRVDATEVSDTIPVGGNNANNEEQDEDAHMDNQMIDLNMYVNKGQLVRCVVLSTDSPGLLLFDFFF